MSKLKKLARGRECQVQLAEIKDFEGLYSITSDGQVLSGRRGWKPLRHGVKPGGYAFVGLYPLDGKAAYKMVHRLVAEAFIENPEGKPEVNHIDGNKLNNVVDNLEWVTRSENAQHGHDIGLMVQGTDHHSTKLDGEQVVAIFFAAGRYADIGERFGVCKQTVCNIKKRRIHKKVLQGAGL